MVKVLIVDDSEQNLYMLHVLLEGNGYTVETAANGAEALEKARREPPALIVTDILMPVMDGFTLCREWQQDERLRQIPFVFYTATYTDPKDEALALSLGAERFIVKPAEPDVFVGILRQVLKEAEAGRLRVPGKAAEEEPVYLKTYSERLVRKLEDKMVELERAHRRLNALYGASTALAAIRPPDELVPYVMHTVVQSMDFDNASYFKYDPQRQELRLLAAVGFPDEMVAAFQRELVFRLGEERGLAGLVGQTREPLVVSDTRGEPRWITLDGTIRSALFVPVVYRGELLGVASFLSTEPDHFGMEDARNVMTLANNVGIAVQNANLVDRLSRSEARYRRLAENAPDIVFRYRVRPTPGFEYVSPAATEITGYTPEERYADPDLGFKLVHPDDRPLAEAYFSGKGILEGPLTVRWVRKDGEVLWIEQRSVPIYDEAGNLVALEGIARDVTSRKQAEEQVRASLQEKEHLLRELYHRTRNNMQVISSMLALQAAFSDSEQVHQVFQDTQNRIQAMALVHEKLYQSQNLSSINLDEYVGELAQLLVTTYRVTPSKIAVVLDTERISTLIDTAVPCGLILNELISNALKHAFPGERSGEIRVGLHRTGPHEITLEVSDNGVGMANELDVESPGTFGLQTVITIARHQLQGTVTCAAGEAGRGVSWQVRFQDDLYQARV